MDFCFVAQAVEMHLGQQHVDTGWVKVVSSLHLLGRVKVIFSALVFFNLCDVVDDFLLRCSGSGIVSVA